MVLLALKSQFASLIITIVSIICEFSILWALRTINGLYECRTLKRNGKVFVENHIIRSTALEVVSFLSFLMLEIFASFFSDPTDLFRVENHPCISVGNILKTKNNTLDFPTANVIFARCLNVENGLITQSAGNYSNKNGLIQCAEKPMYSFRDSEPRNRAVSNATIGCIESNQGNACTFGIQRGNRVFLSNVFLEIDKPFIENEDFFETILHFESKAMLKVWAERTASNILDGIVSPAQLRRLVFTGAEGRSCDFDIYIGDATSITAAFLILLLLVWILSLMLFFVSLGLKRKVFYNLRNVKDWATKTILPTAQKDGDGKPYVYSRTEDGETNVFLSSV